MMGIDLAIELLSKSSSVSVQTRTVYLEMSLWLNERSSTPEDRRGRQDETRQVHTWILSFTHQPH